MSPSNPEKPHFILSRPSHVTKVPHGSSFQDTFRINSTPRKLVTTSLARGRAPRESNPDTQEVNVSSSPRSWGQAGRGNVGQEVLLPTEKLHFDVVPETECWQES